MADLILQSAVIFLVVIDPIGLLPVFVGLTRGEDAASRRRITIKACSIALVVLVFSAFVGDRFLDLLGISLEAFRVAGGLFLLVIAFEMAFAKRTPRRSQSAEEMQERVEDVAVFPLAMPLLAGPGAITSVLLLMGEQSGDLVGQAIVLTVMAGVLLITFILFLFAGPLERVLGRTLSDVVTRILGILLAALSVQFILDGVRTAWGG